MIESFLFLLNLIVLVYCAWIAARVGRKKSSEKEGLGLLTYKNEEGS